MTRTGVGALCLFHLPGCALHPLKPGYTAMLSFYIYELLWCCAIFFRTISLRRSHHAPPSSHAPAVLRLRLRNGFTCPTKGWRWWQRWPWRQPRRQPWSRPGPWWCCPKTQRTIPGGA